MRSTEAIASSPNRGEIVAALREVTMTFDSYLTRILNNVNLEVHRGEILALLGPKDSGKTTALRILAGRLRPSEGKAELFGRAPRRAKRRLGYLPPPADGLPPAAGFLARLKKWFSPKKRALPPIERRAALAQALAKNPELLVLDEPFAGLDAAGEMEMSRLILSAAQRGATVVFSAASLVPAKDLCHRAAILVDGRIQAAASVPDLLAGPEAVRWTAPVLPAATAERVLKILREDLAPEAPQASAEPAATTPPPEPAQAPSRQDEILATLTQPSPGPAAPAGKPAPPADAPRHELLDELTKPPQPPRG